MGRRFNDEPINLIRRIPSPEQLEAARPAKPTFGQLLSQKGAAFVRSAMEAFSSPTKSEGQPDSQDDHGATHDQFNEEESCLAPELKFRLDEGGEMDGQPPAQHMAALSQSAEVAMSPPRSVAGVS